MLHEKVLKIFAYCIIIIHGFSAWVNCTDPECPSLSDADSLSQTQLLQRLAHGCRYDRFERPTTHSPNGGRPPVDVYVRAYIYFMQNLEAHDLQFKIYALLQLRFLDPRLIFRKVAPTRKQPILGEQQFRDILWMPHIFLANERDSSILGTTDKNILTSISPDGTVIISTRIEATLYCWMNLKKFPFDEQQCPVVIESWMFNTSELVLHWEQKRPITFNPELRLTEYELEATWANETVINADLKDLRRGAFAGNYSSLSFTMSLNRVVGYYIMGYFFPSMLIVAISWVSFWLQADQVGSRIMLGTSTMLTFITLATAQGKTLPKVSYIKVSEVWFMGCTLFIFGSLLEFATVNLIWRRQSNVYVRKIKSKHVLKSVISNRHLKRSNSCLAMKDAKSVNLLDSENDHIVDLPASPGECVFDSDMEVTSFGMKDLMKSSRQPGGDFFESTTDRHKSIKITSQQIAMWIDCKARCLFPLAFLIFNIFFWILVYLQ